MCGVFAFNTPNITALTKLPNFVPGIAGQLLYVIKHNHMYKPKSRIITITDLFVLQHNCKKKKHWEYFYKRSKDYWRGNLKTLTCCLNCYIKVMPKGPPAVTHNTFYTNILHIFDNIVNILMHHLFQVNKKNHI